MTCENQLCSHEIDSTPEKRRRPRRRRDANARGVALGAAVAATLALGASDALAAQPLLDVPATGCITNRAVNSGVGQSFMLPTAAAVESVEVWLRPNVAYNASYQVHLYSGNAPTGTALATSNTVTVASAGNSGSSGFKSFAFPSPPDLLGGTPYSLQVVTVSQYAGAYAECDNPYSGGQMYDSSGSPKHNEDLAFRIHGTPPPSASGPDLLLNGNGATGNLQGWTILANQGGGWNTIDGVFRTGYEWNTREQLIDLYAHGHDADSMASAPPIFISQDVAATYCPDQYFIKVQLLAEDMSVLKEFDTGTVTQTNSCSWGNSWDTVAHEFLRYPSGVRYIRWHDGGIGSESWAGHYGPRFDNARVTVGVNLLANPDADDNDLAGWTITHNGGDGWTASNQRFRTSYNWNLRTQLIDLDGLGFDAATLDSQPTIHVYERFRKWYCPDYYLVEVELLDADMEIVESFATGVLQNQGSCDWTGSWETVQYRFENYGPGVRYIRWKDGGMDSEHWAGHYGVLLDHAMLALE